MLSSVGPLSSVVAFVPARVDADVSVHSAVVLKLQAAGARVSKQLGATTTHVVLLQKLLPSFAEQVLQDDLIKDLYERIEKMNSRARIVSNLWVHASTESGTKADEDGYTIRKPTDPEDLNFYSSGMPVLKGSGRRRSGVRLPGPARARRKSTPLPLPSTAFSFDVDAFMFSSSQQINELGGTEERPPHVVNHLQRSGSHPQTLPRSQGTKRSASAAHLRGPEALSEEGGSGKKRIEKGSSTPKAQGGGVRAVAGGSKLSAGGSTPSVGGSAASRLQGKSVSASKPQAAASKTQAGLTGTAAKPPPPIFKRQAAASTPQAGAAASQAKGKAALKQQATPSTAQAKGKSTARAAPTPGTGRPEAPLPSLPAPHSNCKQGENGQKQTSSTPQAAANPPPTNTTTSLTLNACVGAATSATLHDTACTPATHFTLTPPASALPQTDQAAHHMQGGEGCAAAATPCLLGGSRAPQMQQQGVTATLKLGGSVTATPKLTGARAAGSSKQPMQQLQQQEEVWTPVFIGARSEGAGSEAGQQQCDDKHNQQQRDNQQPELQQTTCTRRQQPKKSVLWAERLTPDTSPSALLPVNPSFAADAPAACEAPSDQHPQIHTQQASAAGASTSNNTQPSLAPPPSSTAALPIAANPTPTVLTNSQPHKQHNIPPLPLTTQTPITASPPTTTNTLTPEHALPQPPLISVASAPGRCERAAAGRGGVNSGGAHAQLADATALFMPPPSATGKGRGTVMFHSTGKGRGGATGATHTPLPTEGRTQNGRGRGTINAGGARAQLTPAAVSTKGGSSAPAAAFISPRERGSGGSKPKSSPPLSGGATPLVSPRVSPKLGLLAVPKLKGQAGSGQAAARAVNQGGSEAKEKESEREREGEQKQGATVSCAVQEMNGAVQGGIDQQASASTDPPADHTLKRKRIEQADLEGERGCSTIPASPVVIDLTSTTPLHAPPSAPSPACADPQQQCQPNTAQQQQPQQPPTNDGAGLDRCKQLLRELREQQQHSPVKQQVRMHAQQQADQQQNQPQQQNHEAGSSKAAGTSEGTAGQDGTERGSKPGSSSDTSSTCAGLLGSVQQNDGQHKQQQAEASAHPQPSVPADPQALKFHTKRTNPPPALLLASPHATAAAQSRKMKQSKLSFAPSGPAAKKAKVGEQGVASAVPQHALTATAQAENRGQQQPQQAQQQTQQQQPSHALPRQRKLLAHSSVPPGFLSTIQAAVRQIGGANAVVEGHEDARASHLIIGAERRTLKVLLALTNGAHVVTPEWVHASMAADRWLPEADFRAPVRFEAVASSVRSARAAPDASPDAARPLANRLVCVHCTPPASTNNLSGASDTRAAMTAAASKAAVLKQGLQRLVVALGGRVVPPRACNLMVVSGGGPAPETCPPGTAAVTEEWLLLLAETHSLPDMQTYAVGA